MRVSKNTNSGSAVKKKNNFLLIFVCIFLATVILFGAIFGIIAAVSQSKKIVRFGSLGIDEGEARYLASYHKNDFMIMLSDSGINCYDAKSFWDSESDYGKKYGELLADSYRNFISGMLVSISLFDKETSLASADRERINEIAKRPLKRLGSVKEFNTVSEKYGFDYDDYKSCVELLYKAAASKGYFVGVNGSKLTKGQCSDYFEQYSHVALLFLYDETLYYKDDNGQTASRPLSDSEKAERTAIAQRLRELIASDDITPETIEYYYPKSDSDQDMLKSGYYLKRGAVSTDAFEANYPEVVSKALEMQIGEYAEVECGVGVCFIYKYENSEKDIDTKNPFFSDFYSDAADFVFSEKLEPFVKDVEFGEDFDKVDVISVPQNYELYISTY